jgi:hypothetical protein
MRPSSGLIFIGPNIESWKCEIAFAVAGDSCLSSVGLLRQEGVKLEMPLNSPGRAAVLHPGRAVVRKDLAIGMELSSSRIKSQSVILLHCAKAVHDISHTTSVILPFVNNGPSSTPTALSARK